MSLLDNGLGSYKVDEVIDEPVPPVVALALVLAESRNAFKS